MRLQSHRNPPLSSDPTFSPSPSSPSSAGNRWASLEDLQSPISHLPSPISTLHASLSPPPSPLSLSFPSFQLPFARHPSLSSSDQRCQIFTTNPTFASFLLSEP